MSVINPWHNTTKYTLIPIRRLVTITGLFTTQRPYNNKHRLQAQTCTFITHSYWRRSFSFSAQSYHLHSANIILHNTTSTSASLAWITQWLWHNNNYSFTRNDASSTLVPPTRWLPLPEVTDRHHSLLSVLTQYELSFGTLQRKTTR
jgi:hypothetical protein